jgi:hypothetical protein
MRDAVIEGFAIKPGDMKRVATPSAPGPLATTAMELPVRKMTSTVQLVMNSGRSWCSRLE